MRSDTEVEEALNLYRPPNRFVALFRRALRGGNKRKLAIRAHCLECCGYSFNEVKRCEVTNCVFYIYRLGQEIDVEGLKFLRVNQPGEEVISVDEGSKAPPCDEDPENEGVRA